MALEFALRPRIRLDRPAPRRRLGWLRLPPLALPIGAYWLAIAGVTHAWIQAKGETSSGAETQVTATDGPQLTEPAPSETPAISRTSPELAAAMGSDSHPPKRDVEPAPAIAAPEQTRPERAHQTQPQTRTRSPAEDREPMSGRTSSAPLRREATSRPARSAGLERIEEPAQLLSEPPTEGLREETGRGEAQPGSLPSCESAAATANQIIDLRSSGRTPDLTRGAFASVLEDGAYFAHCAIPRRTALEICAAVQDGKVVGVSVTAEPRDAAISACVRRAVSALRFPRSPQLDVTRTRFESTL